MQKGAWASFEVIHHELVHMVEVALSGMNPVDPGGPSHLWFSEGLAALISGTDSTPKSTSEVNTRIS